MVKKSNERRSVFPITNGLRNNVGVRNPYAMINVMRSNAGEELIEWNTFFAKNRDNPIEIKRLCVQYLWGIGEKELSKKLINLKYKKLFDPKHCSPLYAGIPDIWSETNLLGPPPSTQCEFIDWKFFCNPPSNVCYGLPKHSEICQGAAIDCYFIAALCSLIHVQYTKGKEVCRSYDSTTQYYTVKFYSLDSHLWQYQSTHENIRVFPHPGTLPVDTPFAKGCCNDTDVSCRTKALWPCIFEKAYNAWTVDHVDCPDPANFAGGNPITSLIHLTGRETAFWKNTLDPKYATFNENECTYNLLPNEIYKDIYSVCCNSPSGNGRAVYPAVAYTYPTDLSNPLNIEKSSGKCVYKGIYVYDNDTIVANHSYSILGVYDDTVNKYIILRNPYGPILGDPNLQSPDVYQGTWRIKDAKQWSNKRSIDPSIPYDNSIDLSPEDGRFGLKVELFQKYFQAFGWITI